MAKNKRYEEHPFAFVVPRYIAAGSEMLSVLPPLIDPVGCCLCIHLSVCLIMLLFLVPPRPRPVLHEPQVMHLRHKYGPIGEGTFGTRGAFQSFGTANGTKQGGYTWPSLQTSVLSVP